MDVDVWKRTPSFTVPVNVLICLEYWENMRNMIRDTSLSAYEDLDLGSRQRQIYDIIKTLGCPTNLEISAYARIPINQVTPRTNELVKMGLVTECEKRECSISGRLAYSWRLKDA